MSGSYWCETDYDDLAFQRSHWGTNYEKLLAVKDAYDPDGLFICHHCVGSERWTKESDLNCRVVEHRVVKSKVIAVNKQLKTLDEEANLVTDDCTLAVSALEHFKHLTFYGQNNCSLCSMSQTASVEGIQSNFASSGRSGMLEVAGIFFGPMQTVHKGATNPNGKAMRGLAYFGDAAAKANWTKLVNQIKTLVGAKRAIAGFNLGDELVHNNISWSRLNSTAALVKAAFPDAFVFYNEGGDPLYGRSNMNGYQVIYPSIPPAVDYVSTDVYHSLADEWENGKFHPVLLPDHFYAKYLFPLLLPHQGVWVVPPVSNLSDWNNTVFTNCSAHGNSTAIIRDHKVLDACVMEESVRYLRWIERDARIAGIDGFHWGSYGADIGLRDMPKSRACYEKLGAQLSALKAAPSPTINAQMGDEEPPDDRTAPVHFPE